ncbi:multidrug effflux MFS transporter [Maritalea sp.]|uniref:multidrug effflux MFS transporter n=1 Tax=Maritalea sp. TaxID=2003361 RepID=UPI003EFA9D53
MRINPKTNKVEFIILIALLMALNAVAIDIMLPALPIIGAELGAASANDQQFVLTLYLAGFGISQLFYGPLSDSIGRRPTVFIGIVLFMIPVAAAPWAPDFTWLLALRFIQGLGAGASRVIAMAIVRDSFEGRAMAQIMSFIMMIFMAMPIIAPSLGQAIILVTTWHFTFLFMAMMAIITLTWAYFRLPETLPDAQRSPFSFKPIMRNFGLVLRTKYSIALTFANMFLLGTLLGFLGISPLIYLDIYNLGPIYPLMIALTASNLAIASLINARIVVKFGPERIAFIANCGFVILASIWAIAAWQMTTLPLWLFVGLHQPIMLCFGFAGTNQITAAMQPLGKVAGTASSTIGFFQTAGGALVGASIGYFYDGSILPVCLGFVVCGLLSLALMQLAKSAPQPKQSAAQAK